MIATMAKNMPNLDDECRTTLIIVPAALLQQVCGWVYFVPFSYLNFFKVEGWDRNEDQWCIHRSCTPWEGQIEGIPAMLLFCSCYNTSFRKHPKCRNTMYANTTAFWTRLIISQVVVTTYQTLNQDFNIPKDCEPADEAAWLEDNG
jgi:hypothetical protein